MSVTKFNCERCGAITSMLPEMDKDDARWCFGCQVIREMPSGKEKETAAAALGVAGEHWTDISVMDDQVNPQGSPDSVTQS